MPLNPFLAAFEPMRKALRAADAERAAAVLTGTSADGRVRIELHGDLAVESVVIDGRVDAEAVREALEDLVTAFHMSFGRSAEEQVMRLVEDDKLYCPVRGAGRKFANYLKQKHDTGGDT